MEQRERAARAHALRLLKTKLQDRVRSHQRRQQDTDDDGDVDGAAAAEEGKPVTVEDKPPEPQVEDMALGQRGSLAGNLHAVPARVHPDPRREPLFVEHPSTSRAAAFAPFACKAARCACRAFFYVVAEGAWILRCRCKHKHTDHDAGAPPFACRKPGCACDGFGSPWVCNCDHPWIPRWNAHVQETVEKLFRPLELIHEQFVVPELSQTRQHGDAKRPDASYFTCTTPTGS